jgi:Co/Zn/Cd efflux system component
MNAAGRNLKVIELSRDWIKHIGTLSMGALLIMVIFLNKLTQQREWKSLITVAVISFVVSILGAFSFQLEHHIKAAYDVKISTLSRLAPTITEVSFLIGLISLAAFAIRNLSN